MEKAREGGQQRRVRARDEREGTRPAREERAQPRTEGSETGGNREPPALNRGLRGTEPVGQAWAWRADFLSRSRVGA